LFQRDEAIPPHKASFSIGQQILEVFRPPSAEREQACGVNSPQLTLTGGLDIQDQPHLYYLQLSHLSHL
jgi:hypothetical protein